MFAVTEADAIRAAYNQDGELSAVAKLMDLFPAITHPARARLCVRILTNRKPLTLPPASPPALARPPLVRVGEG
jgi:hypothetical protein